MINSV